MTVLTQTGQAPSAPRVAQKRLPLAGALALVERRADACLAALPFELGGNDFGVVEHQHIARLEQIRKIQHLVI